MKSVTLLDPKTKKIRKAVSRPSAAKKYPGQIVVGIARMALILLHFSNNEVDATLKNIIWDDFLGKSENQDYKVNSVKKFRSYLTVSEGDKPIQREVKKKFFELAAAFFEEKNYNYWLQREYRGTAENRLWFKINRIPLIEKILHNKKAHFYLEPAKSPYEFGELTVQDDKIHKEELNEKIEFAQVTMKIKTE